uniref:Polyphemusin-2 n=1 Tax=Limulus polyphemus TaxID=6850 RepID=PPM2_LIMPO|nr:RecName: Full=Polyphemusin-2; AltName: Full=Polyphemusin II [Limulus polyphemus]
RRWCFRVCYKGFCYRKCR